MSKRISIVVPVYNEADNLERLHQEVMGVFDGLPYEPDLILVDDGSQDDSSVIIERLAKKDARVKLLQFSRNFGQQAATSAGIIHATGDAVIIMDADLQHPPRLIPEFIRTWEGGIDVVIGVRNPRRDQSALRRWGSDVFFSIMNKVSESETEGNASDFRLLDKAVVEAFRGLKEKRRLTRALIDWLGFKRAYVHFDVDPRAAGTSHYDYRKLLTLALSSVIAHSRLPLLVAGTVGSAITLLAGLLGVFIIVEQLILGDPLGLDISPIGMTALLILFLNGIVLLFLGVLSLYVAAVREEVQDRPFFVLRKAVNFDHVRK